MSFGLEQEDGSLITPTTLAHPLHPIISRLRNEHRNLYVCPAADICSGPETSC